MEKESCFSLAGEWLATLRDGSTYVMQLPGTLDENRIGGPDDNPNKWHPDAGLGNDDMLLEGGSAIATRLTRKYTYEGPVRLCKRIHYTPTRGKRVFLEAERGRCLKLFIDDEEIAHFRPATISTPHVFEVTGKLTGDSTVTLVSDNSYPGLPHDAILASSAATDETQTNWNGILGEVLLREEEPVFIENLRVYPGEDFLTVLVELNADREAVVQLSLESDVFPHALDTEGEEGTPLMRRIPVSKGRSTVTFGKIRCREDCVKWDEYEGNLHELKAQIVLEGARDNVQTQDSVTVRFGMRTFSDNGSGRLALNRRVIFLRSEANCAVFPEEGHSPMTVDAWKCILEKYKSYGVNCMRFHSHCPPEAAFTAADELGMLMQPELSHWNPKDALEDDAAYRYYMTEMSEIILQLANHPSFVMLTLGNELAASQEGRRRMEELVRTAQKLDSTRMYAIGSNTWYGAEGCDEVSDFYTTQKYYDAPLRGAFAAESEIPGKKGRIGGHINNRYPGSETDYEAGMARIREAYAKPVFSFEVGQFEVLPDFDELDSFRGVTIPANYERIRSRVRERGLEEVWKRYVEATGEIALLCYREEVEAVLRTETMSGISLLGLQDFPGQGTALVGMMNSHLDSKPYAFAQPQRFQRFFREALPLAKLPRYTYENTEELSARLFFANYGKETVAGTLEYVLREVENDAALASGRLESVVCPAGGLTQLGEIRIPLARIQSNSALQLELTLAEYRNEYPVWVYLKVQPKCPMGVYETQTLDEKAIRILQEGGKVFFCPRAEKKSLPNSIGTQFSTDFWSVGTFAAQEGGMGQLIDDSHPLFDSFPTKMYPEWQWWPMAGTRAFVLPGKKKTIVTEMDSYAFLRPMAKLLECRFGPGKLMLSSMGLQDLQEYPEARALLDAIYRYMDSDAFAPEEELTPEELASFQVQHE